jgi:hypothetical protein
MGVMTLMVVVRMFLLVAVVCVTARAISRRMFVVGGIVHIVTYFELTYTPLGFH